MFCAKCGAALPEGSKSCPACGAPAESTSSAPQITLQPASGTQTSENPLARFWNSPKFGWAEVYFNRIMNYVYIGLGLFLLAFGWWMFSIVLIGGGAMGIYSVRK